MSAATSTVPVFRTPSGVRIGAAYRAPTPSPDADAARLQTALLHPQTSVAEPRTVGAYARRALIAFIRWC